MTESGVQPLVDPAHLREVALTACKHSSRLLQHMPGYQADAALIKEAMRCKKHGRDVVALLSHASETLRGDRDFMYWAVTTHCGHFPSGKVQVNRRDVLKLASKALLDDAEFLLSIMGYIGDVMERGHTYDDIFRGVISSSLMHDRAFVYQAVQYDVKIIVHASRALLESTCFVESVMRAVVGKECVRVPPPVPDVLDTWNPARVVLNAASYALRWDPKLIEILPGKRCREEYLKVARGRWARARMRWQRAVRVLLAIQRMHKDLEARDARAREADLAEAMLTGGAVADAADAAENERYMGLLRMAWDMGRAAARAPRKRPREP